MQVRVHSPFLMCKQNLDPFSWCKMHYSKSRIGIVLVLSKITFSEREIQSIKRWQFVNELKNVSRGRSSVKLSFDCFECDEAQKKK